jgi:hypothetical protein
MITHRKKIRFTFLCNEMERDLINKIALVLERSQGDSVRILIVNAARDMGIHAKKFSYTMEKANETSVINR